MIIDIQARDFQLTDALSHYIRRRLDFALSPRYEQIQQIQVRLSDVNGPRGGKDKCCQLHIVLPRLQDVVVDDTEVDMYVAINRAIDRAGRSVTRRLSKRRIRHPRSARPPFTEAAQVEQEDHSLMQA